MLRKLDIVIAVDSQNLLHDVALAINVNHVRRSGNLRTTLTFFNELVSEICQDIFNDIVSDLLADECLDPVIIQVNDFLFNRRRIGYLSLALDMSACQFKNEHCRPLGCKRDDSRVRTSFISE